VSDRIQKHNKEADRRLAVTYQVALSINNQPGRIYAHLQNVSRVQLHMQPQKTSQNGGWSAVEARSHASSLKIAHWCYNNNNNIQDNVYGAVIMAEPLREFI